MYKQVTGFFIENKSAVFVLKNGTQSIMKEHRLELLVLLVKYHPDDATLGAREGPDTHFGEQSRGCGGV